MDRSDADSCLANIPCYYHYSIHPGTCGGLVFVVDGAWPIAADSEENCRPCFAATALRRENDRDYFGDPRAKALLPIPSNSTRRTVYV